MSLRTLFLGLLAALTVTAAPALSAELPGFGNSDGEPIGETWPPPEGIELSAFIESYNPFDPEACKRPEEETPETPPKGLGLEGGLVRVCLHFRNTTREPINVELPPGLIVVSDSRETQHGMIVQKMNLEVPLSRTSTRRSRPTA